MSFWWVALHTLETPQKSCFLKSSMVIILFLLTIFFFHITNLSHCDENHVLRCDCLWLTDVKKPLNNFIFNYLKLLRSSALNFDIFDTAVYIKYGGRQSRIYVHVLFHRGH